MKKRNIILVLCLTTVSAFAGSRTFVDTNDVTDAYYSRTPLKGWQAESVDYTLTATKFGEPVQADPAYNGTSGYYPVWFLFDKSTSTTVYWAVTGTVVNATNGVYNFTITPEQGNVSATRYRSIIKLYYATNGENEYVETLDAKYYDVQPSPDSAEYNVVTPFAGSMAFPTNDWFSGAIIGSANGNDTIWTSTPNSTNAVAKTGDTMSGPLSSPTISLGGTTNVITDDGTNITRNGVLIAGGGTGNGFPLIEDVSAGWHNISSVGLLHGSNLTMLGSASINGFMAVGGNASVSGDLDIGWDDDQILIRDGNISSIGTASGATAIFSTFSGNNMTLSGNLNIASNLTVTTTVNIRTNVLAGTFTTTTYIAENIYRTNEIAIVTNIVETTTIWTTNRVTYETEINNGGYYDGSLADWFKTPHITDYSTGGVSVAGDFDLSGATVTGFDESILTNVLQLSGGTVGGPLYLTSINNPATNEAVTADFVRRALDFGRTYYFTTNIAPVAFTPTNTTTYSSLVNPAEAYSRTVTVTGVNQYVISTITTQAMTGVLKGPVSGQIFYYIPSGFPSANYAMSVKPEMYWTTNLNQLTPTNGDWSTADSFVLAQGSTNSFAFTITPPETDIVNAYVLMRVKITLKGSSANSLTILGGDGFASYWSFPTIGGTVSDGGATNAILTLNGTTTTGAYDSVTRTFDLTGTVASGGSGTLTNIVINGVTGTTTGALAYATVAGGVSTIPLNGASALDWGVTNGTLGRSNLNGYALIYGDQDSFRLTDHLPLYSLSGGTVTTNYFGCWRGANAIVTIIQQISTNNGTTWDAVTNTISATTNATVFGLSSIAIPKGRSVYRIAVETNAILGRIYIYQILPMGSL